MTSLSSDELGIRSPMLLRYVPGELPSGSWGWSWESGLQQQDGCWSRFFPWFYTVSAASFSCDMRHCSKKQGLHQHNVGNTFPFISLNLLLRSHLPTCVQTLVLPNTNGLLTELGLHPSLPFSTLLLITVLDSKEPKQCILEKENVRKPGGTRT